MEGRIVGGRVQWARMVWVLDTRDELYIQGHTPARVQCIGDTNVMLQWDMKYKGHNSGRHLQLILHYIIHRRDTEI